MSQDQLIGQQCPTHSHLGILQSGTMEFALRMVPSILGGRHHTCFAFYSTYHMLHGDAATAKAAGLPDELIRGLQCRLACKCRLLDCGGCHYTREASSWLSLDALIGRLCAAFKENEGKPESNPFGALPSYFTSAKFAIHSPKHGGSATRRRSGAHPITLPISAVRFKNPFDLGDGCRRDQMNLRNIRDSQSKARGISYEKKKRRPPYYSSDLGLNYLASSCKLGSNTTLKTGLSPVYYVYDIQMYLGLAVRIIGAPIVY
ncbi:hypothetical protein RJ640_013594 [Escallonia rubra]|uniref:ALOG domain-containing protein n=1 Tax=Escallonia rubra TaxID=112253 RepID=A0AA88S3Z9_9ASTE|nr:hypothetical protein RJ640_013594 [Escallonia rubra]